MNTPLFPGLICFGSNSGEERQGEHRQRNVPIQEQTSVFVEAGFLPDGLEAGLDRPTLAGGDGRVVSADIR